MTAPHGGFANTATQAMVGRIAANERLYIFLHNAAPLNPGWVACIIFNRLGLPLSEVAKVDWTQVAHYIQTRD